MFCNSGICLVGGWKSGANGADYVYQNYTFSFEEGNKTKDLRIFPIDDNIVEYNETYTLVIHLQIGTHDRVLIGKKSTAKITIYDEDGKEIATHAIVNYK